MPSKAALAKIHIAKKDLGLTDEAYRDILHLNFKVESAAALTEQQAAVLLATFRSRGWKAKPAAAAPGKGKAKAKSSPVYRDGQRRKIVALWLTLHQAGVVKNGGDAALQAYVKRMTGVDNLAWCAGRQLWALIEALKQWALREGVDVE